MKDILSTLRSVRGLAKPTSALLLSVSLVAIAITGLPSQFHSTGEGRLAFNCPAGYDLRDPADVAREFAPISERYAEKLRGRYGEQFCVWRKLPESMMELGELQQAKAEALGDVPEGLLRKATEQKAALMARQKAVPNAAGSWNEYGQGPQIYKEEFSGSAGNDGIPTVMGRIDEYVYDEPNKRLFASVGNGGIWLTEAVGGDLSTLGDSWRPLGDKLPSLIASGVAWTAAGGGTLIALTGEHTAGGNTYTGVGLYWSTNLGESWTRATGVPDGALGSKVKVDPSNPNIIYAATGKGLFRSTDAGRNFTNVALPVSDECAGNIANPKCLFANVVTDVIVKVPGGTTDEVCDVAGCPVIAAVGYRAGNLPYADGTPQSPGNGLYRSSTGAPGSFSKIGTPGPDPLLPYGFTPQDRIGRIEMGQAYGPEQDHNIIYAMVQDARLLNGTSGPLLDSDLIPGTQIPIECSELPEGDPQFVCELVGEGINPSYFNGIYASSDFGDTWYRMADDLELVGTAGATGSSLAATAALGVAPGIQSWYNQWIAVDPTQADPVTGAPTRMAFGLEEIWTNATPVPLTGPAQAANSADFKVIGTYFSGETCLFLIGNVGGVGVPVCPTSSTQVGDRTTTHPDQQGGLFVPDGEGGVWLFAGNDGGAYKQHSTNAVTDPLSNDDWGVGINNGFYTLMNYGISVAKDGTVWYGLQDNTSGKIDPVTREQIRIYIGDGMWTAVDPDNSQIAYFQTPGLSLVRTLDGGVSNDYVDDFDVGTAHFLSPFIMDDKDANHLIAAGTKVAETLNASTDATWTTVYDLGTNPATGGVFQARGRTADVYGDFAYVAACGPCNLVGSANQFARKLATNVGGAEPPAKGTAAGWHDAALGGLPNRNIYNVHIDRNDPTGKTVYVVLGGYSTARWAPPGQYGDTNDNLQQGKNVWVSKDAGETFTSLQGNLPDVITSAILRRGNQLIVGTDIGVFISSDLNGTEWAPLGDLPSVPVNQLVLKPGDDKQLFAGTFGRGVQQYVFDANSGGGSGSGSGSGSSSGGSSGGGSSGGRFGGSAGGSLLALLAAAAVLRRRRLQ